MQDGAASTARDGTAARSSRDRPPLWVPLGVLLGLTLLFRFTALDVAITDGFYRGPAGFPWGGTAAARLLNLVPTVISVGLGLYCVIVGIGSFLAPGLRTQRRLAAFLVVSFAIGPGLIVNFIFKDKFGRPRPVEVERYGGTHPFQPVWVPGPAPEGKKSFPSGDSSVGFFLMMPAFAFWRRRRRRAHAFLGLGLGVGIVCGLSRIAQGAHWTTDILWAAGFVYLVGYAVSLASFPACRDDGSRPTPPAAQET